MKLFNNLSGFILSAIKRFPAVFLLTFCTAVCSFFLYIINNIEGNYKDLEQTLTAMACSSIWCAVLSFPAQLFAEQSRKKYLQTIVQVFCILFCFIWYFFCHNMVASSKDMFFLIYTSTLVALIAICPFALRYTQHVNEIVPNIISSLFQSFIILSAISVALFIISTAIETLFNPKIDILEDVIIPILIFCWIAIFIDYFIINVSKHHVDINIPRFLGVIMSSVLVPLYALFITVLYIYLIQCTVTKSFPMREMTMFCSIATALFLIFCLSLKYFDTKPAKIFYMIAPFATVPLIIVQIIITIDRVRAHGISMNRYASMLYILFSIIAVALIFIKEGRFLLHLCPVMSAIALIAGVTPLNLINVPILSQTAIIRSVLTKNGLYEDGKILIDKTEETLSNEDKNTIIRAYNKIKNFDTNPYASGITESFGFSSSYEYTDKYRYELTVNANNKQSRKTPIDISSFKELYLITYNTNDNKVSINYADKTLDITDVIIQNLKKDSEAQTKQEPLIIKDDAGFTCIITNLNARTSDNLTEKLFENYKIDNSELDFYCYGITGFAVR